MHKPLIIGGGYLSTVLQKNFPGAIIADFPTIDITNITSVRAQIEAVKPDLIINAAAFTNTAAAELPENMSKVFALNVQGPSNISLAAREAGIPWVHFSTGMFFDGDNGWTEAEIPNPEGYYAWTKAWADFLLTPRASEDKTLILRIHLPISSVSHDRNFLNRMIRFEKCIDVASSITVVEDMIAAMKHLLSTNQFGLFNAVNEGSISSFEIAELLHEAGKRDTAPARLTRAELDAMDGARQVFPVLSVKKLADVGFQMPNARDAVIRSIENLA